MQGQYGKAGDELMKPTHCLYHANCLDGFAAAYVVWRACLPTPQDCQFIPVQYGDPLPDIPDGSRVAIVDFSFHRPVLDELAQRCELLVLDHHKTAEEALRGAPYAIFDLNRSGCQIAWDYFAPKFVIPQRSAPVALDLVADRDLWKFEYPATKIFCAGLHEIPRDFEAWDPVVRGGCGPYGLHLETYKTGRVVHELACKQARKQAERAQVVSFDGHTVAVLNCHHLISETLHEVLDLNPGVHFAMSYFDLPGKRVFSLRSRPEFDVGAFAKNYFGGGSHHCAAGFSIEIDPYRWPLESCHF